MKTPPKSKKLYRIALNLKGRDIFITLGALFAATALCWLLKSLDSQQDYSNYSSMIFILTVFLTARFTTGYLYGLLSSLISVLAVNYLFTYPYFALNFGLAGYPLTILCMLIVSLTTSALTSKTKQSQKIMLEAAKQKTQSNLLRAVSHDLRTPLTSIQGTISAVLENIDTIPRQESKKLLQGAQEDAAWLIHMVENLLAVTRIEADKNFSISKHPEAAEEVASVAVQKFKKHYPGQNITVLVPDDLLFIPMDPILIEQVLMNLFENAVIHGKITEKISLTVTAENGYAVFTVRDNGVGIQPDAIEHILNGTAVSISGNDQNFRKNMGIGISVCNTIIEAHGGKMIAENAEGGGAVFTFTLPLQ